MEESFAKIKKSKDEDVVERREGELEILDKVEIAEDLSENFEEEEEDLLCYENIDDIEEYLNAKQIEKEKNKNDGYDDEGLQLEKTLDDEKQKVVELECSESFEDIEKAIMHQKTQ